MAAYNHIDVAKAGRSKATLGKVVKELKKMSAYTLLTEHFDRTDKTFFINEKRR
jgi:hypothetical protein